MPRSNYHVIQQRVKEFCQEHGLVYEEKGFWEGVCAMIKSLKDSGQLWADAWKQQSKKVE
jgi:hypothetical protein